MFSYKRSYRGPIQAVIFDWAGTTMDFGCIAPTVAFQKIFEMYSVPITVQEAREPMGAHKKVHIQKITEMPSVRNRWFDKKGAYPTPQDVDKIFAEFVPVQLACLSDYAEMIPGALAIVNDLRKRGYKIGSTTGYTTEMMSILMKNAEKQGYKPDATFCASDVPVGRPYPSMVLKNLIDLQISSVCSAVKIDDTTPGIEEGLNAGCWTIGLAVSGNDVGLSVEEWKRLDSKSQNELRERAYNRHRKSGAHYVVDSITEIMPCIEDIERRLRDGETP